MIMDGLDALTQVALGADNIGLHSFCYDLPSEGGHIRHASEALDEGLNTPITSCSDTAFFGPGSLEPPPITATGMLSSNFDI